jgi:segregation and condensation protein A
MDLTLADPSLDRGTVFLVEIDRFQGPLDLLLHLIKQQDIDVFDIPIARITQQFLVAIQEIEADDLENAGEFLEMAATLVRIKAQMLLPRPEGEEDEDPRAELVRRLLEYELIREIASRLSVSESERARRSVKGYLEPRERPAPAETPLLTEWDDVIEAAMTITLPDPVVHEHRVRLRPVAMEEKVDLILDVLRKQARVRFSRLIGPWRERMHGVMTFLAGLELSRRRQIALRQVKPFTELWYYRQSDESPVPPGLPAGDDDEEAS